MIPRATRTGRPLRLAVVGTDHPHSQAFQETLTQLSNIEVTAILDDGGKIITPFQHLPRYDDLEVLLEKEAFDAAIVTLPADRAANLLMTLAAAGKHILSDKPVCRTAHEMRPLVELIRKQELRFAVAYVNRFRPVQTRAKALVRQGRLGTVFALQAHLFTTSIAKRGAGHYLFTKERSGGGVLIWEACHLIDMLLDLMGEEVTNVAGRIATLGDATVDVEDVASITLGFGGGAVASLLAGYTMPCEPDDPTRFSKKDTRLAIWGSRAKLELEPFGKTLELVNYEAGTKRPLRQTYSLAYPTTSAYVGAIGLWFMNDFITSIAKGRHPRANEADALRVLEVLEAVYDAHLPAKGSSC